MSLGNTLPPQAYTREMLAQAFLWLQDQPDTIKSMAQTPDTLVGLYLRAKRNGESSLESVAPRSTESFRSTLRDLANSIQQFNPPIGASPSTQPAGPVTAAPFVQNFQTQPAEPNRRPTNPFLQTGFINPSLQEGARAEEYISSPPSNMPLDPRSLDAVRTVMRQLNLSHEVEAVRLLISLGFERLKPLLSQDR